MAKVLLLTMADLGLQVYQVRAALRGVVAGLPLHLGRAEEGARIRGAAACPSLRHGGNGERALLSNSSGLKSSAWLAGCFLHPGCLTGHLLHQ